MNVIDGGVTLADHLNAADPFEEGQLAVSKDGIFGPTWQGEGSSVGRRCYFLRLAGCNQHCHWCDTPYTWAFSPKLASLHDDKKQYDPKEEVHKYSWVDLAEILKQVSPEPSMLVISGGEPMLQQAKLLPLLDWLGETGWRIEIETAGTIMPSPEFVASVDQFNCSPKLESSGNELKIRYRPSVLKALQATNKMCWKFVAMSVEDIPEIRHLVHEHQLDPVYIMPEGRSAEVIGQRMRDIAEAVLKEGWNLSTRLQIEIWGDKRGV